MTVRELPAVPAMACLRYAYSPEAIGAYQAIGTWIAAHGYTIAGPGRELWLGEAGDPPAILNEIQFPIARP